MSEVDVKEEDCKKTKLDRILEGIGVLVFVILFMIILYVGHYIMLHATFILAPERIAQKFNLPVFYVKLLWPIFLFICFLILGAFSYIFCENKGYKSKKNNRSKNRNNESSIIRKKDDKEINEQFKKIYPNIFNKYDAVIKTIDGKMELETNIEYIAYKEAINNIYSLCLNSFDNIEILKEQIKERENLVKQEINEEFVTKLTNDINLLQDDLDEKMKFFEGINGILCTEADFLGINSESVSISNEILTDDIKSHVAELKQKIANL